MDLSIIVPIYNVEKYVRTCIESIYKQCLDEKRFEVIIINDGTTDNSMEVIADIIDQHNNITVINQDNQSLSVARNNGIAAAKGEYILIPDSDDLLIENSLKPLLEKALETKVDLVVADFLTMTDEEIDDFNKKEFKQPEPHFKKIVGEQIYLELLNPRQCFVWRTLYRREFLVTKDLIYYPGIRYQDIPFTHECYLKAKNCLRTNILLNIYRKWPGSSTNAYKFENSRHFITAIALTWQLRQIEGLSSELLYKIEENVYISFRSMIYDTLHGINEKNDRYALMDYINFQAPDLNFTHSIQQRLITMMIKKTPHFFIYLYYQYAQIVFKKRSSVSDKTK
ncbi:MAG: glycosyltransferase [Prevotella sp.]|uniref:glycosyltransferase n=1 Tax=Prevotella sp. tf2-5 TaxID=1761889 RepID=UPI0008EC65ED|nr:glycosyltransferase [Prevotella sp. tf2-5]MBR2244732.1 glycosyltransferase [Prevotella sp.]SFO52821.1 Glycosyltransferase involved in cell wall bisynthesis [Prevotella sp. tf2-5]